MIGKFTRCKTFQNTDDSCAAVSGLEAPDNMFVSFHQYQCRHSGERHQCFFGRSATSQLHFNRNTSCRSVCACAAPCMSLKTPDIPRMWFRKCLECVCALEYPSTRLDIHTFVAQVTEGDGDCQYAAAMTVMSLLGTVGQLREAVASQVEGSLDQLLDYKCFHYWECNGT